MVEGKAMTTKREAALDPLTPEEQQCLKAMCEKVPETWSFSDETDFIVTMRAWGPRLLQQLEEMERESNEAVRALQSDLVRALRELETLKQENARLQDAMDDIQYGLGPHPAREPR